MKNFYLNNKNNPWFIAFIIIAAVLLFAMPIMSLDAGNSGDEDTFQIPQGKNILNYYKTAGKDTSNFTFNNLKYYGSSFDTVAAFINDVFNIDNVHITRHILDSLLGWLCILFIGLIAYHIGGWRAGVIAMLMLFLSPRFLGHSYNNPKDIPFATSIVMAVFFMLQFFRQFPKVKKSTVVFLILAIAFSISIRIGGLVLFGYFGIFGLLFLVKKAIERRNELVNEKNENRKGKKTKKISFSQLVLASDVKKLLLYGVGICIVGYFLGLILWPYALQSPIKHPLEAFREMSKFAVNIRQNFEGFMYWSSELPWYYTSKFILITIPIAVIIGFILYLVFGGLKKKNWFTTFIIYFCAIFPVFWLAYTNANVYGGWRHSLFAYPFMAAIAGLGFDGLIGFVKNRYAKIVTTVLPFVLLLPPFIFIVKNHPYEYVYFNEFVGGTKGAYGNYELDYYYHSTRELSEWVIKNTNTENLEEGEKLHVVTWHQPSVGYFFRNDTSKFSVGFSRWHERGYNDWDYGVFTITGINPELQKSKKAFPPKNTVYQVKVDGVPIGLVLKREDKNDFFGHQAMQQGRATEAVTYLRKALDYDEYNEQALNDLITIYTNQNPDSAFILAKHWVAFNKGNTTALNHLANLYFAKGDMANALRTANAITKVSPHDISGLWIAANIYAQQGKLNEALRSLQAILRVRGNFKPAYQLMAQIYEMAGDRQRAQQIINAMNSIP